MSPADAHHTARLAQGWVEALSRRSAEAGLPPLPDGLDTLSLARALKDLGYAALHTDPPRAAQAADALARLAVQARTADPALAAESAALADWLGGASAITQGRMVEALATLDRAEAGFLALGQPGLAAQTRVPCIIALTMLGRLEEAAACGQAAQQAFLALGDRLAAARVGQNLGSLHMRQEAYAQAARHYREAAVLFARARQRELSVMADIGLADALTAQGDLDEARRIYARADMRARAHGLALPQALVQESAGLLDLARGHYRDALAGLEGARAAYQGLDMPQHLAIAEKQLADAYAQLRLWPEALRLYAEAGQQFDQLSMPYEQAWTRAQIGRTLARQGRVDEAQGHLAAAALAFASQDNPVGMASVALAEAEGRLAGPGAAEPGVEALARTAIAGFERAGQADGAAQSELALARCLLAQGRLVEAQAGFVALLARADEHGLPRLQVPARDGLGQVAWARGDIDGAQAAFEAASTAAEDLRRALPGDELRSAFLGEARSPDQGLLRVALARAQAAGPAPSALRAAHASVLAALERLQARSLADHLARQAAPQAGHAPTVAAADDALRQRLQWLYQRTQRLDLDEPPPAGLVEERQRLEARLLENARRERLREQASPAADATAAAGPLPSGPPAPQLLDQLAQALPADAALLRFAELDGHWLALGVTARSSQLWPQLTDAPGLQADLRALRFQLESLRVGEAPMARHLPVLTRRAEARLQALHARLWAPLAPWLAAQGVRRLLLVPQGALASLPFAALHAPGEPPVGQTHELALAYSAKVALNGLVLRPAPARQALVLSESTRLPYADAEARAVAAVHGCTAWVGPEASKARLRTGAPTADLIHLACHGQFRSDNPMFSALHLADAPLTVEAVGRLALRPATVVLSACDTAAHDQGAAQGDEMLGLVRAFQQAGAARVVASLWPVDDAVTAAFMARFHQILRAAGQLDPQAPATPARALQQAQAALRQSHPHPAHWAAFVVHGGW